MSVEAALEVADLVACLAVVVRSLLCLSRSSLEVVDHLYLSGHSFLWVHIRLSNLHNLSVAVHILLYLALLSRKTAPIQDFLVIPGVSDLVVRTRQP